jgi:serine/threonine-protein kinase RsbT
VSGPSPDPETLPIEVDEDVIRVRQRVRQVAVALSLRIVDQTKLVTAASELARNTLDHGHGGRCHLEVLEQGAKRGIRLTFEDEGPGIPDVDRALEDGYTTGKGMGLGLGGSRRLVNEFSITSAPGQGTRVTITRWA